MQAAPLSGRSSIHSAGISVFFLSKTIVRCIRTAGNQDIQVGKSCRRSGVPVLFSRGFVIGCPANEDGQSGWHAVHEAQSDTAVRQTTVYLMRRGVIEQSRSARKAAKAGREPGSRLSSRTAQAGGLEHEQVLRFPTQRRLGGDGRVDIRSGIVAFGLSICFDRHRLFHA